MGYGSLKMTSICPTCFQPSSRELAIEKDIYMYRAYTAQVSKDIIHYTMQAVHG